jgi:trehalose 2-sulfotransferase
MTRYAAYMICTSPRSGSTLLCKLLAATGIAGHPESWFYRPDMADWQERMEVVPPMGATDVEVVQAVFAAAIRVGTAGGGPFGLRQQGESFPFLLHTLAGLYPDAPTDVARFERAFGPTLFIHLSRADKVDQAVSYLRAEQTGLWHVAPDGTELERVAAHREPVYDAARLQVIVEMLVDYDRVWAAWFSREAITPLRVGYDDLAADPGKVLRGVLGRLGLDPAAAAGVRPGVRKLADATSRDWVDRFRAGYPS